MRKSSGKKLKVLVLEPYFGGSHKSFLMGLSTHLPYEFNFMTLPARKWKWRMRLSAPYYADKLNQTKDRFDRILCSTFVDVATFRGLAPEWVRQVPLLTYLHENQFAYPIQVEDKRDFHFALTNLTTALASDSIAFNSEYNFNTFLDGTKKLLKKSHDLKLTEAVKAVKLKSLIIPPGIDFSIIDSAKNPERSDHPVILWNHRWEHDKNPELFFETLFKLESKGVDFRLVILGESFKEHPVIFERAKKKLGKKILQFGYVKSTKEYATWLKQSDIVVSTANHEFFGISVIEAVRAGCRPLLPDRLSYPELFPKELLYKDNSLTKNLEVSLKNGRLGNEEALKLTKRFSWEALKADYMKWIMNTH